MSHRRGLRSGGDDGGVAVRAQRDAGGGDGDDCDCSEAAHGVAPKLPPARTGMDPLDRIGFDRLTKSTVMQDVAQPALEVVVPPIGAHDVTSSVGARCGAASDSSK
jgi:hypothetical protein